MKIESRHIITFFPGIIFCVILSTGLCAQPEEIRMPAESGENILLLSDRNFYSVSETLYYSARYAKPELVSFPEWSSVLYVDLIQWNGANIGGSKAQIKDNYADGTLQIPPDIPSGVYYLRAYTRWMRNYSPYDYTYIPVKIINPFSSSVDKGPGSDQSPGAKAGNQEDERNSAVFVSGLEESYPKRGPVELEFTLPDHSLSGNYCVSVAKTPPRNELKFVMDDNYPGDSEAAARLEFYPEIQGLSIYGRVVLKENNEPVPLSKVNLSSYSGSFYHTSVTSGPDGSFIFVLPDYQGNHEFNISCDGIGEKTYDILITSEFCNRPVTLPYTAFQLDEYEKETAREIMLNAQLNQRYRLSDSQVHKRPGTAFYGLPTTVIKEKDFIELDDLKEFFYELVPNVSVAYKGKEPYLVVRGQTSLTPYPPLILVDNIPVPNDGTLLGTACRRIDRIEVINTGYVVGDYKYSGVISIFSEKKDLAEELAEESQFFNYSLFSDNDFSLHDYSIPKESSPVPDRRNLLFWEPRLRINSNNPVKVRFYTSDSPGKYQVTLRGFEPGNSHVYVESCFTVR